MLVGLPVGFAIFRCELSCVWSRGCVGIARLLLWLFAAWVWIRLTYCCYTGVACSVVFDYLWVWLLRDYGCILYMVLYLLLALFRLLLWFTGLVGWVCLGASLISGTLVSRLRWFWLVGWFGCWAACLRYCFVGFSCAFEYGWVVGFWFRFGRFACCVCMFGCLMGFGLLGLFSSVV